MSMPAVYDDSIVCNHAHKQCIDSFSASFDRFKATFNDICLNACWESAYRSKISFSKIKKKSILANISGLEDKDMALLTVYYPLRDLRAYRKTMLNNFTEFLCE